MSTPALNENKPYIFISYAHKDSSVVLPIIKSLIAAGFLVWYDEGIEAGTEWPEYVAEKLYKSSVVIAFISKAALESQNCRREINFAISKKKEMLTVFIENLELSLGMEMQLGTTQAMFYTRMPYETFLQNLKSADILKSCKGDGAVDSASTYYTPQPKSTPSSLTDFKIENGILIKYVGSSESVVIPDFVTSIGDQAFLGCEGITSITLPDSVNYIGSSAFKGCSRLTDINLPRRLTNIGKHTFDGCSSLKSISIPDGVRSIGECAFCDCTAMVNVKIPDTVESIGDQAFTYCASLEDISIPSGTTHIGIQAFDSCQKLSFISIPNSVISISKWAFIDCPRLAIYCEAMFEPDGWDADWNPDKRPVSWRWKPFSI
jgi:hypothetical protein